MISWSLQEMCPDSSSFYSLLWEVECNSNKPTLLMLLAFFPLAAFNILVLVCIFSVLISMWQVDFLFWSTIWSFISFLYLIGISFCALGKFASMILLKILSRVLNWGPYPSSFLLLIRLSFLFQCLQISCMVYVRNFLVLAFSLILISISPTNLQCPRFSLPSLALCWWCFHLWFLFTSLEFLFP